MKARVKATGEILEFSQIDETILKDTTHGDYFSVTELEILFTPDQWARLEHQYAGMAMQGILSNPDVNLDYKSDETMPQAVAETACKIAHALVEKLKEESK